MTHEATHNPNSQIPMQDIIEEYPAMTLLADAQSYSVPSGDKGGLSGEQLRSAKSIDVARKMVAGDTTSLLGDQHEALQPGYAIYSGIVEQGLTALGEGDVALGQKRMEIVLSVHDLAKSAMVADAVTEAYSITDHDMGFSRLVADNFTALEGRADPSILDSLRSTVTTDPALVSFFARERGIDPGFNVGRHLQGEADFTLFEKTVHEVDPVTMAEFTLDLLGGDGNTNPNGPVKFSNIPPAFNGIAVGLKKLMDAQGKSSSSEDLHTIWQELAYPEADLARLGLNRSTPRDIALTRLAFMGREHQLADADQAHTDIGSLRTSFDGLDLGTQQEIVDALQDTAGLDLGFAPHVMDALRQKVGTDAAYGHLLGIIAQVCEADAVRTHPAGHSLTVNLNNKFDWSNIGSSSNVHVVVSEPDASGVINANFSIN
jgi:hypothetical protein